MPRPYTSSPLRLPAIPRIVLILAGTLALSACESGAALTQTPAASPAPTEEIEAASCVYSASIDTEVSEEMLLAQPGGSVRKSWTLLNDGDCDWTGVTLVLLSGAEHEAPGVPVPSAAAGSSTELAVDLVASAQAGMYSGEFRLRAPDGTLFGPTLHAQMVVQPLASESLPPPQSPYGVVAAAGCILDAAFVADISLADGANVQPNNSLQKTWRIQNTGTCDWQGDVALAFISGNPMGAVGPIMLPPARSGETVDIAINLTAPAQDGAYTGVWQLQSADGALFGVLLYTQINVGSSAVVAVPNDTPFSPFIHNISYHSREIFLDGQSKGNQANIFTKVGDSITDVPAFLNPIGDGNYALHDYAYLQPAVNYFSTARVRTGNSFNNQSLAAVWGWSSFDVLNPDRVAETCPGITPLACEYSIVKPSVAIIMIGTNDALGRTDPAIYEGNLRQIVEISIQNGVIPVLSTIPWSQFADTQPYNQVIITTAIGYDVPWMDFYGATLDLANHGIAWEDGVHPSIPGTNDPAHFTEDNLHYGHTVRNLLVLHVLDRIWREVLAY